MNPMTPTLQRVRARLADESGVAMIVAMAAMLIIGVLAAGAVTLSVNTNQQARHNVEQKQALEASEAGLQAALYRYNMLVPDASSCVGDASSYPATSTTPAGVGEGLPVCHSASAGTPSGGNASYEYWTTSAQDGATATCTGPSLSSSAGVSNICITSVGTSGNQTVRTEMRAASYAAQPLFPANGGIIGLNGVSINKNGSITGNIASNGTISLSNNTVVNGYAELGPAQGSLSLGSGASAPTQTLPNNLVLAPVNPENSAQTNNNTMMTLSGGATYTNTTLTPRALDLGNGGSVTLSGGIYNFCSVTGNQGSILTTTGEKVEIFIDSVEDPGSGCLNNGVFDVKNGVTWTNYAQDPTTIQVYIYGPNADVYFKNNGVFDGILYAPTSSVSFMNNGTVNGAVAGSYVTFDNNLTFNWGGPEVSSLDAVTQGLYYRTGWGTCTATMSLSNPTAGCS